jgi:4-hydroxy-tetrahydrodipicolinate synthase
MTQACLAGDFKAGAALQLKYFDLIKKLFIEVNPIPVKAAMNLMGMNVGGNRLPLCDMEEDNLEKLKLSMQKVGLIR